MAEKDAAPPPKTPQPSASHEAAVEPEEPVRVLVIDDEPNVVQALSDILQAQGMQVFTALYGEEGLRLAAEHDPDVILLDIRMPGISGYDVCTKLKDDSGTHHIPIVFLTGKELGEENIVRGLDMGAYDYITKPYRVAELVSRVRVMARIKASEQQVRRLSVTDELTGLYNRRFLLQRFEEELSRARRYRLPLACVLIDIDRFKRINDTYGHQAGDQVLRRVAELVRWDCRKEDIVARYGGEEFMVVLSGDEHDALGLAERIRHRLETTEVPCADTTVTMTASIGVAGYPNQMAEGDINALMNLADQALYEAKHRGRNCVVIYTPEGEQDTPAAAPPEEH